MSERKNGLIFNIQRFSINDGPGIRTTVFLKGCPLRCQWCHNPEGIESHSELIYRLNRCTSCGNCIDECPEHAITRGENGVIIERLHCNRCFKCINVCYSNALEICGEKMTIHEVLEEVLSDLEFYKQSRGGITISGGEPLIQYEFLKELLKEAKKSNLHVCLDTTGYIETEKLRKLIQNVDIVLYDIKSLDEERHKNLTGVSNKLILENLKQCINENQDIIIRIPVINGYNFIDLENELQNHITRLIELGIKKFELIPYHQFGEQKYEMIGKEYNLKIKPLDKEKLSDLIENLKEKYKVDMKVNTPIIT